MIRLFFKRVLGKDGFPFFVFRKAASEVVYAANVFRFLLMFPFLKLRNHRLRNRIKRLETAIAYVNGRSRT